MRSFVFNIWGGELEEIQEVLVIAKNVDEAQYKLSEQCSIEYGDYELDEEIYYDDVIY